MIIGSIAAAGSRGSPWNSNGGPRALDAARRASYPCY